MKPSKELRAELRAVRKEMKSHNIRQVSCFNAGLSFDKHRYNTKIFRLKTEIEKAEKQPRTNQEI